MNKKYGINSDSTWVQLVLLLLAISIIGCAEFIFYMNFRHFTFNTKNMFVVDKILLFTVAEIFWVFIILMELLIGKILMNTSMA